MVPQCVLACDHSNKMPEEKDCSKCPALVSGEVPAPSENQYFHNIRRPSPCRSRILLGEYYRESMLTPLLQLLQSPSPSAAARTARSGIRRASVTAR